MGGEILEAILYVISIFILIMALIHLDNRLTVCRFQLEDIYEMNISDYHVSNG